MARIVALSVLALAAIPAVAGATETEPVQLSWQAPAASGCPDDAYARRELTRYLGPARERRNEPISARISVRAVDASRWQLALQTRVANEDGERRFEGESCRAVVDAAIVVLAWMADPDAMAAREAREAPPAPAVAPPVVTPAPSPVPPAIASPPAARARPFLGLGAVLDAGTLPKAAIGAEVRGGVNVNRLRLSARAAYWPTRHQQSALLAPDQRPVGADFQLATFAIEACVDLLAPSRRFGLAPCVGPELDLIHARGFGVSEPAAGNKAWLALSLGLEGRLSLPAGLQLFSRIGAVVPSEREHFALREIGEIHRPALAAFRAGLGLELEL